MQTGNIITNTIMANMIPCIFDSLFVETIKMVTVRESGQLLEQIMWTVVGRRDTKIFILAAAFLPLLRSTPTRPEIFDWVEAPRLPALTPRRARQNVRG